jgi:hypothetical protein
LKIINELSEVVNRRRTDNPIAKRKRTQVQTMIHKTLHRQLTIEQHETWFRERKKNINEVKSRETDVRNHTEIANQ